MCLHKHVDVCNYTCPVSNMLHVRCDLRAGVFGIKPQACSRNRWTADSTSRRSKPFDMSSSTSNLSIVCRLRMSANVDNEQEFTTAMTTLLEGGKLPYDAGWDDPADTIWIESNTDEVLQLQKGSKNLGATYVDYVRAILAAATDKGNISWMDKMSLKDKKKHAEEESTKIRTICRHIRREWYKKSKKTWMTPFVRPQQPIGPIGGAALQAATLPDDTGATATLPDTVAAATTVTEATTRPKPTKRKFDDWGMPAAPTQLDSEIDEPSERTPKRRLLERMSSMSSQVNSPSSVADIIEVPYEDADVDVFELSTDEDQSDMELQVAYQTWIEDGVAYRQLILDGTPLGTREPATRIRDVAEGEEFLAEFLDGDTIAITGHIKTTTSAETMVASPQPPVMKKPVAMRKPAAAEPTEGTDAKDTEGDGADEHMEEEDEEEEEEDPEGEEEEEEAEEEEEEEEGEDGVPNNDDKEEKLKLEVNAIGIVHSLESNKDYNDSLAIILNVNAEEEKVTVRLLKQDKSLRLSFRKIRVVEGDSDDIVSIFRRSFDVRDGITLDLKGTKQNGRKPLLIATWHQQLTAAKTEKRQLFQISFQKATTKSVYMIALLVCKAIVDGTIANGDFTEAKKAAYVYRDELLGMLYNDEELPQLPLQP